MVVVARHLTGALHGAVSAGKVRVVPSGIDLDRFKPMEPLACKQKLGWSTRTFHVLFASSSGDPVKRPWLARAAVAQMSVNEPDRPAEFHYLSGLPTQEVPLWLNASDALLLTSLHEGSPNIVKESLACGLPVVSVDVGDVAERIEGIEGCHLARAEPVDLATKLRLVRQRAKRLDPALAGRLHELSIQSVAQKLEQCYEEITSAHQAPRRLTSLCGRPLSGIRPTEEVASSVSP